MGITAIAFTTINSDTRGQTRIGIHSAITQTTLYRYEFNIIGRQDIAIHSIHSIQPYCSLILNYSSYNYFGTILVRKITSNQWFYKKFLINPTKGKYCVVNGTMDQILGGCKNVPKPSFLSASRLFHQLCLFTFPFALFLRGPLVVLFLAFCQADFELDAPF